MYLFFEILCAYLAAVGLFFLLREAYYCISGNSEPGDKNGYITIYIAREDENEEDVRRLLEDEEIGGRVFVIFGNNKQIEKKITDMAIKSGRLYIKK
ncbi:MAG TPA: hypothetical protein DD733_11615 [Clostridiales bacterium]|mgnify:CR=1 FL=1|nr:hypothetical protein [Eubacteriales bacterium]HBR32717.1 hypothetical protein [Clostridiales bacterium]